MPAEFAAWGLPTGIWIGSADWYMVEERPAVPLDWRWIDPVGIVRDP